MEPAEANRIGERRGCRRIGGIGDQAARERNPLRLALSEALLVRSAAPAGAKSRFFGTRTIVVEGDVLAPRTP
jgi:hypothetical protein